MWEKELGGLVPWPVLFDHTYPKRKERVHAQTKKSKVVISIPTSFIN